MAPPPTSYPCVRVQACCRVGVGCYGSTVTRVLGRPLTSCCPRHCGTTPCRAPQTLGRGAGYPTVSCFGSAKVRLNFQGPFVWRPSRGEQVHQTFHAVGSKRSRHSHASNRSGAAADAAELPGAVTAQDLMGALETADQVRACARARVRVYERPWCVPHSAERRAHVEPCRFYTLRTALPWPQNNDWGEEKKKETSAGDLMAAMQAEGW